MKVFKNADSRRKRLGSRVIAVSAVSTLVGTAVVNAAVIMPSSGPVPSGQGLISLVPGGSTVSPTGVNSGDTFDIAIVGVNANNSGAYLAGPVDPVFGGTSTFTGEALGGQVLTVTSSEVVGALTTTDTISISVPTNFDPTGTTIGGLPIVTMFAEVGGYAAGTDTLDFSSNVSNAVVTGDMIYAGGPFALDPAVNNEFSNGGMSLATAEGVGAGGADLAAFDINEFDFSITYPNPVPEPASAGIALSVAGAALLRRRRV